MYHHVYLLADSLVPMPVCQGQFFLQINVSWNYSGGVWPYSSFLTVIITFQELIAVIMTTYCHYIFCSQCRISSWGWYRLLSGQPSWYLHSLNVCICHFCARAVSDTTLFNFEKSQEFFRIYKNMKGAVLVVSTSNNPSDSLISLYLLVWANTCTTNQWQVWRFLSYLWRAATDSSPPKCGRRLDIGPAAAQGCPNAIRKWQVPVLASF